MDKLTKKEIYTYVVMLILFILITISYKADMNYYISKYKSVQAEKTELIEVIRELREERK